METSSPEGGACGKDGRTVDWTTTWIFLGVGLALVPMHFAAAMGGRSDRGATSWPTDPVTKRNDEVRTTTHRAA